MTNLTRNITYSIVYQILVIAIPFLTAPYLSRVLGAEGIGLYSYAYSVALWFSYFIVLGLTNYGNREIAAVQIDLKKRSQVFSELYIMQLCAGGLLISIYLIYVLFFAEDKKAAAIMGLCVISAIFDINWFFMGMEQFKLTVTRNSLIKVLTAVSIFVFVKTDRDTYIYLFIMASGTLVSQLCLWSFLKKYIQFEKPAIPRVVKHLVPNLKMFIPVIAISIYKIMDKVMLGTMSTMVQVGYYENAEKILNIILAPVTAIGTVMLPRITANMAKQENRNLYMDWSMLMVLAYANAAMFGVVSVAADFSALFFGKEFVQSGVLMQFLSVTIVFLSAGNVLRTQYLIPGKKDHVYINSAVLGAAVNVSVNSLLIPHYAAIGASVGTIITEMVVCIYQVYCCRKDLNLKQYMLYEIYFCFSGLIMMAGIGLLPQVEHDGLRLVADIGFGAMIYTGLTSVFFYYLFKRKIVTGVKNEN